MTIKRISTALMVCLLGVWAQTSYSQSIRVGYANPNIIVSQLPEFQKIQSDLTAFAQKKETEVNGKRDSLTVIFQKYQETASSLSPEQNSAEQDRINLLNEELQEMGNAARVELQRKQSELLQPLLAKVDKAVADVAKDLKLDFVFNSSTATGDPIILFVNETETNKLDISDKVIEKLTKK